MSPLIGKYYQAWVEGPTLFEHWSDCDRFYRFVKACARYGRKVRNGGWLREHLEQDLALKYTDRSCIERLIQNAATLFDSIMDYERVDFPLVVLEMREPYAVKLELHSYIKSDGTPRYTDEEIDSMLVEHFGVIGDAE
jgi:hypothetical protein